MHVHCFFRCWFQFSSNNVFIKCVQKMSNSSCEFLKSSRQLLMHVLPQSSMFSTVEDNTFRFLLDCCSCHRTNRPVLLLFVHYRSHRSLLYCCYCRPHVGCPYDVVGSWCVSQLSIQALLIYCLAYSSNCICSLCVCT